MRLLMGLWASLLVAQSGYQVKWSSEGYVGSSEMRLDTLRVEREGTVIVDVVTDGVGKVRQAMVVTGELDLQAMALRVARSLRFQQASGKRIRVSVFAQKRGEPMRPPMVAPPPYGRPIGKVTTATLTEAEVAGIADLMRELKPGRVMSRELMDRVKKQLFARLPGARIAMTLSGAAEVDLEIQR